MIRIYCKLESDTLHLSELRPLIGKMLEITVKEVAAADITPGTGDWDALDRAAQRLRQTGYDFEAWHQS